jgi:hypothetical protein
VSSVTARRPNSPDIVSDFHARNRLVWNKVQNMDEGAAKLVTNDVLNAGLSGAARDAMLETLTKLDEGGPSPKSGAPENKEESK